MALSLAGISDDPVRVCSGKKGTCMSDELS